VNTSLTIAAGFAEPLRAAGFDAFEKIMAAPAPAGDITRAVPGRFTTRVEAAGRVLYLKRFRGFKIAWQARNEWERLHELREAGIACATPVALGERAGLIAASESFLMTEEIPNAMQADWWLRDHAGRRREILAPIAALVKAFHALGYSHKDFYLCHFFVQESGGLRIFLLDLQRCDQPLLFPRRWRVKDLAQLHYSMTQQAGYSQGEWREFAKLCDITDANLLRAVEAKSSRLARHTPKYG
jgi:hypothetical protein